MAESMNKTTVRRYIEEVLNAKQIDLIDELFAPALREQVKGFAQRGQAAFPDGHERIDTLVEEGDTVAALWIFTGTQTGPFLDIPPTNRKVEILGMSFYFLKDGQIVDDMAVLDMYGAVKQLGARLALPPDVA